VATQIAGVEPLPFPAHGYAALFHSAGDAMLLISDVIADCNARALTLFRARRDQMLGRLPSDFFPAVQSDGRDSLQSALENSAQLAAGEVVTCDCRFRRPDDTVFDASVTLNAVRIDGESVRLAVLREDSSAGQLKALLAERTEQLQSAVSELDSLSYSLSHDLRAAVSGIAACSRIVLEDHAGRLDEEGRRWLTHIHDDSVQLDRYTESLRDLSSVSRASMHPTHIDMSLLALEIAGQFAATMPDHCVQFNAQAGLTAWGDSALLRTALENLLENAWKFTRKTPQPRVDFGATLSGPAETVFFIRDNGIGFDMAQIDRLFAPFQQLHRDPGFNGAGVGLATVRRIVHRHGGRVWASGQHGSGAAFFFTLGGPRQQ
jgi:signal transduction histidine kinase